MFSTTALSHPVLCLQSLHHAERQRAFLHACTRTCEIKTHTHTNAEHLITLLTICGVLIETPPSPSSTCIPSLIISEGAFGGSRVVAVVVVEGGEPPEPPLLTLTEINIAAICCRWAESSGAQVWFSRGLLPSFQNSCCRDNIYLLK